MFFILHLFFTHLLVFINLFSHVLILVTVFIVIFDFYSFICNETFIHLYFHLLVVFDLLWSYCCIVHYNHLLIFTLCYIGLIDLYLKLLVQFCSIIINIYWSLTNCSMAKLIYALLIFPRIGWSSFLLIFTYWFFPFFIDLYSMLYVIIVYWPLINYQGSWFLYVCIVTHSQ